MHVLGLDVDMAQEILVNTIVAALLLCRLDGIELVEAVDLNALKRHLASLITLNQLTVYAQRRLSRRKTESEETLAAVLLMLADRLHDHVGYIVDAVALRFEDRGRDLLITVDDILWRAFDYEAPILR